MKQQVLSIFRRFGYDLRRLEKFGINPYADIADIKGSRAGAPVVFDVGANVGQTVRQVRDFFPNAILHCFEPSPKAFAQLSRRYGGQPGVYLNNIALGSRTEERELLENEQSVMSSFLPLGDDGWGSIEASTVVPVSTVDEYCTQEGVGRVDLLKIDTQGYEMEVLGGATSMLSGAHVEFVLAEVNFAALYENCPSLNDITTLMSRYEFELVSLYNLHHLDRRAGWADLLFCRQTL